MLIIMERGAMDISLRSSLQRKIHLSIAASQIGNNGVHVPRHVVSARRPGVATLILSMGLESAPLPGWQRLLPAALRYAEEPACTRCGKRGLLALFSAVMVLKLERGSSPLKGTIALEC
jgi:hypothetical protein